MLLNVKRRVKIPLHCKAEGKKLGEIKRENKEGCFFQVLTALIKMVLARGRLPACSWQPTHSSKLVGIVGKIWPDMHLQPVFWRLSSKMSGCHCVGGRHMAGWVASYSTDLTWNGRYYLSLWEQVAKMDVLRSRNHTLPWSWPHAPPCTSGSLSEHVNYSWHTAHRSVQASVLVLQSAPTNRGPLVWEWQFCGFKKEPVHPAAEKPVDSAVFLPHFPFCSDLTLPQCHYSCRWSGTLHTKVSFSPINMNI